MTFSCNSTSAASRYKAIFFDLDDTLLDFKSAEHQSLCLIYEKFYKEIVPEDEFMLRFYTINKKLWSDFEEEKVPLSYIGKGRFQELSDQISAKINTNEVSDLYEFNLAHLCTWIPGAQETILTLKNNYTISIVTNGFARVQRHKYELFSIEDWCHSYIISEEVGTFKPRKQIFDIALTKVQLMPQEVLMVGDSITGDYNGALNAGIDFCWVNCSEARMPDNLPQPKYVVKSVEELPDLLHR